MAELDDKLLKNLDKTLQSMNQRLQGLEQTLAGVKEGMVSAFNPAIIKSFTDSMRGLKAIRLIEADEAVKDIKKIKDEIDSLESKYKGEKPLKKGESLGSVREELSRYKAVMREIDKGSEQRAIELANIRQKERDADLKAAEVVVSQREQAERRKSEIARAWAEQEAREKAQREKMKTAAEKAAADERIAIAEAEAKKKSEIAKAWAEQDRRRYEKDGDPLGEIAARKGLTGTLAALEDQTAVNEWRKQTAEEQKRIAKEEAEVEKQIKKEIAEEEKKLAAEEKQRYQDAVAANKAMTKAEDDLAEAKRKARTAESKAAYTEDTKQRIEEERKAARERAQQAKEVAAIQKKADAESMANQRRQIQIKSQLSAIDKNRISITKQSSDREKALAAQQQADYRSLQSELSKLIARQKELNAVSQGSGRRAKDRLSTYTISESEKAMRRYADAVRNAQREQKKLGDETNKMLPTIQRLASAFGVAFSVRGLAQFGKKLIETRGEFELQQVALRSILQNKQLADEIWDKTMQAALQSPFTAMQLTKYTKQLAAYRIETDKLFDTTKRLADVSAGLGVDMQRLILAYGQVKAANYLRASEIRQFTEAGVNILGELSQYFTETREGMYDTAKVMDMVTKRMVKFEDVEAIFKRMTDQGGIFYEMQYVQSQTVKGQINKLRDAYDQMQNSIGKANEGVLKDMVSLLNSIVKNWRTWAVVLKSIAWGAVIGYLSKFALPLMGIGKASVSTLRSIVKLRQGVQSLGASLKANLPMLGIFAATAVITALNNLRKKMNEVNKEIDEQNLRLYETRQNFEGMKSKIEENNRILKTAGSKTEDLNKAQKENESIMQRLRNEYPQLADQMQIATNGIIDMNDALDANIRKLNEQMTVLNAMKQGNWFSDSDQKNLADWQGALATMKTTLIAAQSEARKKVMQMELGGETDEPLYDIYKKVADIDLSGNILDAVSAFNLLNGEVLAYQSNLYKGTPTRSESLYSILGIKVGNLQANWSENRVKDVLDRLAPTLQSYYENGIKDNADFLKEINEQYGGNVTQFIQANAEKINQATLDGLNNANSILINTLKPQTAEMKTFLNQELNRLFGTTGIDYFSTSTKGKTPTTADPEGDKQSKIDAVWRRRINLIEEMKKRYDELSKSAFGYAKSEKTVREAFDDSFAEIFKGTSIDISQIDFTSMSGMMESMKVLLEKAKGVSDSVREELMKKIDSFEAQITIDAQVRIREDFGKQMEKAFNDYELTLDIEKLNLPSDVLADMFDIETVDLSDLRNKVVQFYEERAAIEADPTELVKQVEGYYKKIDDMERKQQRERIKEYAKYLEYELSERAKIEMEYVRKAAEVATTRGLTNEQKNAIDKRLKKERDEKLAKQEWEDFKSSETYIQMMEDLEHQGVGALSVMREELERIRKNAANLSPRALKEVVNALEKIDEITIKRGMPIGNIIRAGGSIKDAKAAAMEAGVDAEQVKSRKAARETLEGIKRNILEREKEYRTLSNQLGVEKELARLESERAKNNAKMEAMFGDTFAAESDEQIQQRIAEAVSNIETSRKNIAEYQEQAKEADEETLQTISTKVAEEESNLECLLAERELLEETLRLRIAIAKAEANRGDLTDEERKQLQERVEQLEEELKKLQAQAGAVGDVTKKYGILGDTWNDAFQKFGQWGSQVEQTFESFKGMMQALGTDVDTDTWDTLSTSFSILNTATSTAASAAAKFASGDYIGASLDIIKGLMDIATQIAELHDKKIDRSIEKSKEKVEDLQKAYDRLEKSIEKTFDTVSYIREYNQEVQNLNEQIKEANRQIAAAQDYKSEDKKREAIEAAEDAKQEALDSLEEIKQAQIEVFGGTGRDSYRSAAEGFVDAWKSAFLETGDGLQGLQDHFDEFLQDWFVKQATMQGVAKYYQKVFDYINGVVEDGSVPTYQQIENARLLADEAALKSDELMQAYASIFGLGGEGSLSGLAAGIQGMTEEQANVLEGYWNSVRGYTASIDMNVARIVDMMAANYGGGRSVESNPMLQQLNLIAANTAATHTILQSVTKSGHAMGGSGIKVFVN